jgi:hypothetical protein
LKYTPGRNCSDYFFYPGVLVRYSGYLAETRVALMVAAGLGSLSTGVTRRFGDGRLLPSN